VLFHGRMRSDSRSIRRGEAKKIKVSAKGYRKINMNKLGVLHAPSINAILSRRR
jgi:hypothetical protein